MKKIFILIASTVLFSSSVLAADVVCGCEDDTCKDVEINFVASNPGVYLNVMFNEGNKVMEGFATVTSNKQKTEVVYRLGSFTLVKKDGVYSMPMSDRVCK